tara:strand:+ start:369 stop:626 length:258 start_codon:yes stop_codon:yes gene_type:complete
MKVIIRITQCQISSAGFLIKEAWMVNENGKLISKANISDKFAIAMKGTDLVLEVAAAVTSKPNKEPKIEIKDPRQKDMFFDKSGK